LTAIGAPAEQAAAQRQPKRRPVFLLCLVHRLPEVLARARPYVTRTPRK
jgi:hypothetical protein